jgi:methylglutaconyl-CoA hydratase
VAKSPSKGRARATRAARDPDQGFTRLVVSLQQQVAIVTLNRPELHNAFDEVLIDELTEVFAALDTTDDVRAIVLCGAGKSFCAGADVDWMRRMASQSRAQNLAGAKAMAAMYQAIDVVSKPTLARVHGNCIGGGVGLVACCDIAVGAQEATFSLSEARLGLIPATVSPYVIEAIGARQARRYFLSAERFEAAEAFRIGLLHDIVPLPALDRRVNELLGALVLAGPRAQAESKKLIRNVAHRAVDARLIGTTAGLLAAVRASPEGKEGVAAFLAKRAAAWVPKQEEPAADAGGDAP